VTGATPGRVRPDDRIEQAGRARAAGKNSWSGILFGVGTVAFLDEAIFHQVLHWHHFYDLGTSDLGLVSDGFFHGLSWAATIGGLFLFADLRRQRAFSGVLLIAGGVLTVRTRPSNVPTV